MYKKNEKGSMFIISILLIGLMVIIMIYFMEILVPASRNTKGIENGTMAYYNALSGVEEGLLLMKKDEPTFSTSGSGGVNTNGFKYEVIGSGNIIPIPGEGNSVYSKDWNRIGIGEPVQIAIGAGINWSDLNLYFRVPDTSYGQESVMSLDGGGLPIINWILTGPDGTLYATGANAYITANEIGVTGSNYPITNFSQRNGITLDGTGTNISTYYGNGSSTSYNCTNWKCTLKLSIINPLITNNGYLLPYIEYKLSFNAGNTLPIQYAIINSKGTSNGFQRSIKRKIKQRTTSEALDFTVFQ